jgi:hypothetical protein
MLFLGLSLHITHTRSLTLPISLPGPQTPLPRLRYATFLSYTSTFCYSPNVNNQYSYRQIPSTRHHCSVSLPQKVLFFEYPQISILLPWLQLLRQRLSSLSCVQIPAVMVYILPEVLVTIADYADSQSIYGLMLTCRVSSSLTATVWKLD